MSSADLFSGTAWSYANFRPDYPGELLDLLVASSPGRERLLDLGCGTGEIARPLSREFGEVIAVDQEPDMIEVGRTQADRDGIENISWHVDSAERTVLAPRTADLITVGSAFHWMDRPHVLGNAVRDLSYGGVFTVVGGNSPWTGKEPWQQLIVSVLERYLGPERRAGKGTFRRPTDPHQTVMASHGFADVKQYDFLTSHTWTVAGIIGYLKSTSFASRAVLGDRGDEFDRILTDELLELNPSGLYSEGLPFYALIGHPNRRQA